MPYLVPKYDCHRFVELLGLPISFLGNHERLHNWLEEERTCSAEFTLFLAIVGDDAGGIVAADKELTYVLSPCGRRSMPFTSMMKLFSDRVISSPQSECVDALSRCLSHVLLGSNWRRGEHFSTRMRPRPLTAGHCAHQWAWTSSVRATLRSRQ